MSERLVLEWIPLPAVVKGWKVSRASIAWAYWHGRVRMVKVEKLWLVNVADMTLHFGQARESIVMEPPEYSIYP